jgi:hypothetical protein
MKKLLNLFSAIPKFEKVIDEKEEEKKRLQTLRSNEVIGGVLKNEKEDPFRVTLTKDDKKWLKKIFTTETISNFILVK